jgi:hypothetical protein
MANLIIGLCIGFAACAVLMVMWKIASDLRQQLRAEEREEENDGVGGADFRR